MTATELVLLVLKVEGVALAATLTAIFGYAAWSRSAKQTRSTRMSAARAIFAAHLETGRIPAPQMTILRGLSSSDVRRFLFEIAPSVGATERAWLRELARELGELDAAVLDLRSDEWWTRLAAARLLTLIEAEPHVMLPLATDREPMVRAQIATYVAGHPTPEGIDRLIAMLADENALCRFAAKDALMRLGVAATPILVSRLANPDDALTIPLLEVASAIPTHAFLAAAMSHAGDPRPGVRLLAARLLRGIGGPSAAERLTRLAGDTDMAVRVTASEALGYLNHWVAAPTIAKLLDDPESRVRLEAALALDRLGPAGELLLRRARSKGSERASAAASRILDDPSRAPYPLSPAVSPADG